MHSTSTMRRISITAAAAAALALSLTGCGSSGSSSGGSGGSGGSKSASVPKACDLVTAAIAGTVTGTPAVKKMDTKLNAHETQCQYGGPKSYATVDVGDCSFMKEFSSPADGKPVTGVGDSASAGSSGLFTCKGDLGLSIDVSIAGTYTGTAATNIATTQLNLEKQLANALFAAS